MTFDSMTGEGAGGRFIFWMCKDAKRTQGLLINASPNAQRETRTVYRLLLNLQNRNQTKNGILL